MVRKYWSNFCFKQCHVVEVFQVCSSFLIQTDTWPIPSAWLPRRINRLDLPEISQSTASGKSRVVRDIIFSMLFVKLIIVAKSAAANKPLYICLIFWPTGWIKVRNPWIYTPIHACHTRSIQAWPRTTCGSKCWCYLQLLVRAWMGDHIHFRCIVYGAL